MCPAIRVQKLSPASPVVFDTLGIPNKTITIDMKGNCVMFVSVNNGPQDMTYRSYKHWIKVVGPDTQYTPTDPQDATWTLVPASADKLDPLYEGYWVDVLDNEPLRLKGTSVIQLPQKIMELIRFHRWVKFDKVSGVNPDIILAAQG